MTDPAGPTMPEIVSDGSPLPPPISSTFWPIPIRASSTRPDVNGANICAMSTRYFSQYRAEVCHASSILFCSSGFILIRRKLCPNLEYLRYDPISLSRGARWNPSLLRVALAKVFGVALREGRSILNHSTFFGAHPVRLRLIHYLATTWIW